MEQASQLLQHWYQNDYGYLMQVNNRYHQFRLANFQSLAALCTTTLENIASHDQIGKFQMAMLDKTYPVLRGYRFNQEQQLEAMFEIDEYGNFIELNPDYTHWAADEIGIYIYLNLCCQQRQMGSENDRTTIFS